MLEVTPVGNLGQTTSPAPPSTTEVKSELVNRGYTISPAVSPTTYPATSPVWTSITIPITSPPPPYTAPVTSSYVVRATTPVYSPTYSPAPYSPAPYSPAPYTRAVISPTISPAPVSPVVTAPATSPIMVTVSRGDAIRKGVDRGLMDYGMAVRCATPGGCQLSQGRFDSIINVSTTYANMYLRGVLKGLGQTEPTAPGAGGSWWSEYGPAILQSVGSAISSFGQYLQARDIKNAIEAANVPKPPSDAQLQLLLAQLKAAYPDQADKVEGGTKAALGGQSWLMPLLLVGGGLAAVYALKK